MLSFDGAVNILNNIPFELVSVTFNYLNGIDMIHFINNDLINYSLIKSLNISEDEVNVWKLMKNSNKKVFEWCKILYYADINNNTYKIKYEEFVVPYYKTVFSLPSNKEKRYNKKLYIGLFMSNGLDICKAFYYSNLDTKHINFIVDTMNKYPNDFTYTILNDAIKANKDGTDENIIKCAFKIKEIYGSTNSYINHDHLSIAITRFSDENHRRLISLLKLNVDFSAAYNLSNPKRKFTEALVNKFKELREELDINDDFIVTHLRNNKSIEKIRLFKSKNISSNGIINLMNIDKQILENLIANNNIYDFSSQIWYIITTFYYDNNQIYQEIFTKFTIKQQNNLRMKQLLEDGGYNELLVNYIKENIDKIYMFKKYTINTNITLEQYFNSYFELTDFQMNTLLGFWILNFTYEEALANTYQTIDYSY